MTALDSLWHLLVSNKADRKLKKETISFREQEWNQWDIFKPPLDLAAISTAASLIIVISSALEDRFHFFHSHTSHAVLTLAQRTRSVKRR